MKIVALLLCLALPSISLATVDRFKINSELYVDGQLVSRPRVIASGGVPNEIEVKSHTDRTVMKVVATEDKAGILLQFDIEYVKDGRLMRSKAKTLVKPNSEEHVILSSGGTGGKDDFAIKVTADRLADRN